MQINIFESNLNISRRLDESVHHLFTNRSIKNIACKENYPKF